MPAEVVTMFPDASRNKARVVYPGMLWHLDFDDIITDEKHVLLYWCTPDDLVAAFFKSPALEEFPAVEDTSAYINLCTFNNLERSVKNTRGVLSDPFIDRDIGPFRLELAHQYVPEVVLYNN